MIEGVHGNVTVIVHGDVVMVHTSDVNNGKVCVEEMFARVTPGKQ